MPNLRRLIVGRQFLTPLDLERVFGLTEGDIFHGRHDLDQIFGLRPHPKSAQFATPIPGLYLCGSGAHPGGAVSGAPAACGDAGDQGCEAGESCSRIRTPDLYRENNPQ